MQCSPKKVKMKKKRFFSPRVAGGLSGPFSGEAFRGFRVMRLTVVSTMLGPWAGGFHQETLLQQVREIVIYFTLLSHPHHCLTIKTSVSHFLRCVFWNSWWLCVRPKP